MSSIPAGKGTGRKLRLRETLSPIEKKLAASPRMLSVDGFKALQERIVNDPVLAADIDFQLRRPRGVDKRRHTIAGHRNCRSPMLNADPHQISDGLQCKEREYKNRVVKGRLYDNLVMKPRTLRNAKGNQTSAFWGERLWQVFTLKYSRGFVVVTDRGEESRVFPTYGELKAAITKSGWEIVR